MAGSISCIILDICRAGFRMRCGVAGSISCIMLDICRAAYRLRIRRKASIFVRKTLQVRLRDRKMQGILQARREGPAFFDEDDA